MDLLDRVRILFKANNTKILIKFKGETMRKSLCLYSTSKRSYYNNLNYWESKRFRTVQFSLGIICNILCYKCQLI